MFIFHRKGFVRFPAPVRDIELSTLPGLKMKIDMVLQPGSSSDVGNISRKITPDVKFKLPRINEVFKGLFSIIYHLVSPDYTLGIQILPYIRKTSERT